MLGDRIKHFRMLKGMKQSELAEKLFVSPNYISAIEKGRAQPSLPIVVKLFDLLDCSPNDLFEYNSSTAVKGISDSTVSETVSMMLSMTPEAKFKVFSYAKDQAFISAAVKDGISVNMA
ncbi:MAG: helix-turn-helix transcriptional regulator [Synergistes sp.]|nr:helix-turn-helix transcriptional regulator [Synergistes sp.]